MSDQTPPTDPTANLPKAEDLTSAQRIAAINQLRDRQMRGEALSDDQIKYAISLWRAERSVAASRKKPEKKATTPSITLDDFMKPAS